MLTCPRTCSRTPSTAAPRCAPGAAAGRQLCFSVAHCTLRAAAPLGRPTAASEAHGPARPPRCTHVQCGSPCARCAGRHWLRGLGGNVALPGCDGLFAAAGGGGARRDTAGGAAAPTSSGWRGGCGAAARQVWRQGDDPCFAVAAPAPPRGVAPDAPRSPDGAGGCFQPPAQAPRRGLASKLQHPRTVRPLRGAAAALAGRSARASDCQPNPARPAQFGAAS